VKSTVSGVLLSILKKHDINHVIGLPAAQIGLIMNGASRDRHFRYVTTRHEEAAAHMAHAVARVTDNMAVCFGTVGPGATNLVPGVAAAWADNVPLLVITGNNQSNTIHPNKDLLQCANHMELYRSITKWQVCVTDPERAPELFERAIFMARSGRPGPVHLDIPADIGTMECTYAPDSTPLLQRPRSVPSFEQLAAAADLLTGANKPLLLVGGGVARSGGSDALRAFMDATGIPGIASPMGKGSIAADHDNHLGSGGVFGGQPVFDACFEADVIFAVGCKFSSWIPIHKPPKITVPTGQRIIQLDIDPSQIGKGAPVTLGLLGDARESLKAMTAAMEGRAMNTDQRWVASLRDRRDAYEAELAGVADAVTTDAGILNTAAVARKILSLAPDDAIVCIDGGQTMQWAYAFHRPKDPYHLIHNAGMGHLGTGLPFANGAKLAHPDRPVILITGDGAMGCTMQEMETAARNDLKVVAVVCNDSHWGMYRPFAELFDNPRLGVQLTDLDFGKAAEVLGCWGRRTTTLEELEEAFKEAMATNRPAVIDVRTDFTHHPIDAFWPTVVLQGADFSGADS
jgi:acetolactate synthase-1/2/3 large subunit